MPRVIQTLLVANRAEVASRVFATASRLGIRTVAVYSDADATLPYVRHADLAVRLPGVSATDTYLSIDALLAAAVQAGADAIHPGYGFLSERADFARAVLRAGLVWVGPSPESMAALGDKARARALAVEVGVPVVPGAQQLAQEVGAFATAAHDLGYPVLLKASAGGGGRGMRRVDDVSELPAAFDSARREADSAFGDPTLLIERWIDRPRHIEVQILGDGTGRVLALSDRDCSVQRKHQKIVEEAPAPGLSAAMRASLAEAAIRLGEAVQYAGAGTVEFIVEGQDHYFLEVNTRLQVEHEVTECVLGLDLVAWQMHLAEGRPLELEVPPIDGHAIEVRVYAEDPVADWRPTSGSLVVVEGSGDRVRSSYASGDVMTVHYDPMLMKLIVHAPDRDRALRRLRRALADSWVAGLPTNLPLLRDLATDEAFVEGRLHTGILAERGLPRTPPVDLQRSLIGAVAVSTRARPDFGPDAIPTAFRLRGPAWEATRWRVDGQQVDLRHRVVGDRRELEWDGGAVSFRILSTATDRIRIEVDGLATDYRFAHGLTGDDGGPVWISTVQGEAMAVMLPRFPAAVGPDPDPGSCVAPTPGTVRAVHVTAGDHVIRGQPLVVLEAMKMEHQVLAPADGVVDAIRATVGDTVDEGTLLVVLTPDEDSAHPP